MKMPAWLSAMLEGGSNILRMETWTLLISHVVVDRELLQLSAATTATENGGNDHCSSLHSDAQQTSLCAS